MITKKQFCQAQDHALLRPVCTREELEMWCQDAEYYGFASICINPCDVEYAVKYSGGRIKVGTVIGYPQGANTTKTKIFEAMDAIDNGAMELDVVINLSRFKDGDYEYVENELKEIIKAVRAKKDGVIVKVIIERYFISDEELPIICEILINAGADFIKEGTGYAPGDGKAGPENIGVIKSIVGDRIKIKAAHTMPDIETGIKAMENGADRVGGNNVPMLLRSKGEGFWKNRK